MVGLLVVVRWHGNFSELFRNLTPTTVNDRLSENASGTRPNPGPQACTNSCGQERTSESNVALCVLTIGNGFHLSLDLKFVSWCLIDNLLQGGPVRSNGKDAALHGEVTLAQFGHSFIGPWS